MPALVVGIGQAAAGDDGVGLLVVEAVHAAKRPWIRTKAVVDASALVDELLTPDTVILVDAVVGSRVQSAVRVYEVAALSALPPSTVSTHGVGVRQAIELACALFPAAVSPRIAVVGVHVPRPTRAVGVSAGVAALVPPARDTVLSLCEGAR